MTKPKIFFAVLLFALSLPASAAANSSYSQAVLSNPSLVSFWRLGETYADPYDTPGQPLVDATGNHNGSHVGAVATGVQGPLEGDATAATTVAWSLGGYGSVPYSAALNPSTFTIEAWAKPAPTSPTWMSILSTAPRTVQSSGFTLLGQNTGGVFTWGAIMGGPTGGAVLTGPAVVPDRWTYLVATYDGTTFSLYVNGARVASYASAFTPNSSLATNIGVQGDSGGYNMFNGALADIAVYNQALSASMVQSHYSLAINDGDPPAVSFTSAPSGTTAAPASSFTFQSSSVDPAFQCQLDGGSWYGCASPATVTVGDGSHRFAVRAIDRAGLVTATPATAQWSVVTRAPVAAITSGPPALTNSNAATIYFSAPGAVAYQCILDGGVPQPCSSPFRISGLLDGSHTFAVASIDQLGNIQSNWTTTRWTIDTVPPVTYITKGPTRPTDPVKFFFSASESDVSFRCHVDGRPWVGCRSPYTVPSLSAGTHTFTVRATDAAGNVDPVDASYAWIAASSTAPVLRVLSAVTFPKSVQSHLGRASSSSCSSRPARCAASRRSVGPTLHWRLSRRAHVTISITNHAGRRIATFTVLAQAGRGSHRVPAAVLSKLWPGRYTLIIQAAIASGVASTKRLSFLVVT